MGISEEDFIAECLRDLAEAHWERGKSADEFLGMLHPLERRNIAKRLTALGVVKAEKTGLFRKSYTWL